MRLSKLFAALLALTFLGACGAEPIWAPEEDVARAAYSHPGPASLTLVTVINNRSDAGAHTALVINASQRVIWDPAGTWWNPDAPERNDLHYGMTPRMLEIYYDFHSRESFRTVVQEIPVSRAVAEQALQEAQSYGAVPKAACALSTSTILRRLPGFESIRPSYYPKAAMETVAKLPGVETRVLTDTDSDDNSDLLPTR